MTSHTKTLLESHIRRSELHQLRTACSKRCTLLFSVGLVGLLVAFYFPWLTGAKAFYQSDIQYYFEPLCRYLAQAYSAGKIALWNPYLYCGMAQIAVPSPGPLYPLNLVFALPRFSQGLALFMIFHQALAGIGTYLLISKLNFGRTASIIGGLGAALSGYMFTAIMNCTLTSTAAWIPMLCFAMESIGPKFDRSNMRAVLGASVCMFLMVMSGRPEVWVPAVGLVASYVLIAGFYFQRQTANSFQAAKLILWRALACALGLMLDAPMLLPVAEWLQISNRAFGMESQYVFIWSANWYDWLGLVLPQPLGDITILDARYAEFIRSRESSIPFLPSSYLGPVILTLAFFGLWDRQWKSRFWITGAGILTALLALGKYTFVAPLLFKAFPIISLFRYPVKLMIFPLLCLSLLAARGTFVLSSRRVPFLVLLASFVIWGECLITALTFVASDDIHSLIRSVPVTAANFSMEKLHEIQVLIGQSLIASSLVGLSTVALAWLQQSGRLRAEIASALLIAGTAGTLVYACWLYPPHAIDGKYYEHKGPVAEELSKLTHSDQGKAKFMYRVLPLIFGPLGDPALAALKGLDHEQAYYSHSKDMLEENTTLDAAIPSIKGYEGAKTGPFDMYSGAALMSSSISPYRQTDALVSDAPVWRLCKICSAAYVYTECYPGNLTTEVMPQLDKRWFKLIKEDAPNNVRIYKCLDVYPRAFFAPAVKWVSNWKGMRARLTSINPDEKLDAVFAKNDQTGQIAINDVPPAEMQKGIEFSKDDPEQVWLRVTAKNQRLLVVTDTYYPGWQAFLDGKPTPIIKANGFFRAVVIPAGTHDIEFRYEPWSLYIGVGIATLALASLGLLFALVQKKALLPLTSEEK